MHTKRKINVAFGALCTVIAVAVFVTVNSIVIRGMIARTEAEVESIDPVSGYSDALAVKVRFFAAERYIGLTVDHGDLTNIESSFADLIGALEAGDTANATQAKSRLLDALGHLKRLSTLNFDSIF